MKIKKKIAFILSCLLCCTIIMLGLAACGNDSSGGTIDGDAETPVFISQPADATLFRGESVAPLTVNAYNNDNGTLSYQWYKSSTKSTSGGTAIAGATKSMYEINSNANGTDYYYCIVTNTNIFVSGTKSAQAVSRIATITVSSVTQAPRILTEPENQKYVIGATHAFPLEIDASVSVGELTYQWFVSDAQSYTGSEIDNATGKTLTPDITEISKKYFYCEITNTDNDADDEQTYVLRSRIAEVSVDFDYDSFEFETLGSAKCKVKAYNSSMRIVYVPDKDLEGNIVTALGNGLFKNKTIMTKVILPDTVTALGTVGNISNASTSDTDVSKYEGGVFQGCTALETIEFNGGLEVIGDYSFVNCSSLTTNMLSVGNTENILKSIGWGPFQYLPLMFAADDQVAVFPATVTGVIGKYAFQGSAIKKVIFDGSTVTSITGNAFFKNCASLEEVVFSESLTKLAGDAFAGCTRLVSVTFLRPDAVTAVDSNTFNSSNSTFKIYVPENLVSTYKLAPNFTGYNARIEAIPA